MAKHAHETGASLDGSAEHVEVPETEAVEFDSEDRSELVATVATVAVVGIGAAVFEAALLPGLVLGVAATCVPRFFPQIGSALQPLFRTTVRGAYQIGQKTREMVAEAQLKSIPGIGLIGATAIAATVPDPKVFGSGRDFAAWIGLVPREDFDWRQTEAWADLETGRSLFATNSGGRSLRSVATRAP